MSWRRKIFVLFVTVIILINKFIACDKCMAASNTCCHFVFKILMNYLRLAVYLRPICLEKSSNCTESTFICFLWLWQKQITIWFWFQFLINPFIQRLSWYTINSTGEFEQKQWSYPFYLKQNHSIETFLQCVITVFGSYFHVS